MNMRSRDKVVMGLVALLTGACGIFGPSLPGGYSVSYGDRGKIWLAKPNGMMAHGALIKELYSDDRHILLISFPTSYGGVVEGPRPLDGNCFIALMIDSRSGQMRQVRLAEARRLASRMQMIESSGRECLPSMPTA
jgi:hypothetical protein